MKIKAMARSPNIEWERVEYTLKNGATVEIIREKVLEEETIDDEEFLKDIM
ncbi:MAG TPA: hypothetical protein VJC00_04510 [Candidatus Nanoarchaeia archaeon]|nr:hypothetical protein [Candidatus Nanoarchaeia archaeon]